MFYTVGCVVAAKAICPFLSGGVADAEIARVPAATASSIVMVFMFHSLPLLRSARCIDVRALRLSSREHYARDDDPDQRQQECDEVGERDEERDAEHERNPSEPPLHRAAEKHAGGP